MHKNQDKDEDNQPFQGIDKNEIIKKLNAMSPLEEYRLYGVLPWKMITQLFLVIFASAQAIITINRRTNYYRNQERVFYDHFLSKDLKEEISYQRIIYIYSIQQLQQHLTWSLNNFSLLYNNSLETTNNFSLYLNMDVDYNTNISAINNTYISIPLLDTYQIHPNDLGPFNNDTYNEYEIKQFINIINSFTITYNLNTYVPVNVPEHLGCFRWNVYQIYDYSQRSHFEVTLDIKKSTCEAITELDNKEIFLMKCEWMHIIVIILSILNQTFIITSINNKKNNQLSSINSKSKNTEITWKDFIDKWTITNIVGNFVLLIGSILGLIDNENKLTVTEVIIGTGCLLGYSNICVYLEYNDEYSVIHEVIKNSLTSIGKFLVGFVSLFFGCVLFARCVFFQSHRFKNLNGSFLALFSFANGDCIIDIVMDLLSFHFILGQLFSYVFLVYFFVIVMNTFMSIIQRAYVSTKMKNHKHWIYTYIKEDPKLMHIIQYKKTINFKDKENVSLEEVQQVLNDRMLMFAEKVNVCGKLLEQITAITNEIIKEELLQLFNDEVNKISDNNNNNF